MLRERNQLDAAIIEQLAAGDGQRVLAPLGGAGE